MSYLNAKATEMVATHCVCCGRPLLDAVSVELGVGPVCRDKYLPGLQADEDARAKVNALVHQAALPYTLNEDRLLIADQIEELGFPKFAEIVRKRFEGDLIIIRRTYLEFGYGDLRKEAPCLVIKPPYSSAALSFGQAVKDTFGTSDRRPFWVPGGKNGQKFAGWAVRMRGDNKARLQELLEKHFKGERAVGPKGKFDIGSKEPPKPVQLTFVVDEDGKEA